MFLCSLKLGESGLIFSDALVQLLPRRLQLLAATELTGEILLSTVLLRPDVVAAIPEMLHLRRRRKESVALTFNVDFL